MTFQIKKRGARRIEVKPNFTQAGQTGCFSARPALHAYWLDPASIDGVRRVNDDDIYRMDAGA